VYYVEVFKADRSVGFVSRDGRTSQWANDCKFPSEDAARRAKIDHIVAYARANPGHFPLSYSVERA